MKFGDYLKLQREAKGWNQKIAADKIRIEQSYLSKLETGKSIPSQETFERLVSALDIDVTKMSKTVLSSDLEALKDISTVRKNLLGQQKTQKKFVRGWLLAGLVSLLLAGLNIGIVQVQADANAEQYIYESLGVLKAGEPFDLYDIVFTDSPCAENKTVELAVCEDFDRRRIDVTDRVNAIEKKVAETRGNYFIEDVEGGKRIFTEKVWNPNFSDSNPSLSAIIARILSLMFILSTFGCFYLARRWN